MIKFILSLSLLILCSCSSGKLSSQVKKLIVVNDVKYVSECSLVGIVRTSSPIMGGPFMMMSANGNSMMMINSDPLLNAAANEDSMTRLQNLAAKHGNVLVLTKSNEPQLTGSEKEGIVYKCPSHIVFVQAH